MLRFTERLALLSALLAVLLLALRMRTLAVLAACGGVLALTLLPPPRSGCRPLLRRLTGVVNLARTAAWPRCAHCAHPMVDFYGEVGWSASAPNVQPPLTNAGKEDNKEMAPPPEQQDVVQPKDDSTGKAEDAQKSTVEEVEVVVAPMQAEEDDDDPWRDPQLFIAEHVGTIPYARFMRQTPDLQGLGHPRNAPPPSRGRDRLARIVPIPTQSGYNNRPFSNSKFAHLR